MRQEVGTSKSPIAMIRHRITTTLCVAAMCMLLDGAAYCSVVKDLHSHIARFIVTGKKRGKYHNTPLCLGALSPRCSVVLTLGVREFHHLGSTAAHQDIPPIDPPSFRAALESACRATPVRDASSAAAPALSLAPEDPRLTLHTPSPAALGTSAAHRGGALLPHHSRALQGCLVKKRSVGRMSDKTKLKVKVNLGHLQSAPSTSAKT